jgi:hypothetical protein
MKQQTISSFLVINRVAAILAFAVLPATAAQQIVSQLPASSAISRVGGGSSYSPIVTPSGRYVLFASTSANLVLEPGGGPMQEAAPAHKNVFLRDRQMGVTTLVSVNTSGLAGGNGDSFPSAISTNGQFAFFESLSSDLVAGDTNGATDIFVRDTVNNITTLVSVSTNGSAGNAYSRDATITPDGRYVAFVSAASNLVAGDTNGIPDVFVRDVQLGVTTLASPGALAVAGTNATPFTTGSSSEAPILSVDGRYVAFYSTAIGLVTNVTSAGELYLRDLVQGTTTWVSTNAHQINSSAVSANYAMSTNGQLIAYQSTGGTLAGLVFLYNVATGLSDAIATNGAVPASLDTVARNIDISANGQFVAYTLADSSGGASIQLWNSQSGSASFISGGTIGAQCDFPRMDQTGRYVAFTSDEPSLTTNSNGSIHCYLRDTASNTVQMADMVPNGSAPISFIMLPFHLSADGSVLAFDCLDGSLSVNPNKNDAFLRNFASNTTEIVSTPSPTLPSVTPLNPSDLSSSGISSNGQYVAFTSQADGIVSADANGYQDVYVHDMVSGSNTLVSINVAGSSAGNGPSSASAISGNGRYVAFTSSATNLIAKDTNNASDIFLRDLQAGTTTLVSKDFTGNGEGNGNSDLAQISTDGQRVMFFSAANNLTTNSGLKNSNLFWRNIALGVTYALSTNGTYMAAMTPDGSNIVYAPVLTAPNYLISLWSAQSHLATPIIAGVIPSDLAISADAQFAAYDTASSCYGVNLSAKTNWLLGAIAASSHSRCQFSMGDQFLVHLAKDSNGTNQVYLYEFQNSSNVLVSQSYNSTAGGNGASDSPAISANGRFVAYRSAATNLAPGDVNGDPNIFFYDRLSGGTTLVSVSQFGARSANGRSVSPFFSADGLSLFFESWASDLAADDFNEASDIFALALSTNAWSDATNATPPLGFTGITLGTSNGQFSANQPLTLTWSSVPGAGYQVEYKTNLTDPQWQPLTNPATVVGNQGFIIDSSPDPAHRFYRIVSF